MKTMTGEKYLEVCKEYNPCVYYNSKYAYLSDWQTMNKLEKSGTVIIMYNGTVLGDDLVTYHTFAVHPNGGEIFDVYFLAIEMNGGNEK